MHRKEVRNVDLLVFSEPQASGYEPFANALSDLPGGGVNGSPWIPFTIGGFPALAQGRELPPESGLNDAIFLIRTGPGQSVELRVQYDPADPGDTERFITDAATAVATALRDLPAPPGVTASAAPSPAAAPPANPPGPAPVLIPSTSASPSAGSPSAADGDNVVACLGGNCEVELRAPSSIVFLAETGMNPVFVVQIADGATTIGVAPPDTGPFRFGCAGGTPPCIAIEPSGPNQTGSGTGHAGAVITANRLTITIEAVTATSVLLQLRTV